MIKESDYNRPWNEVAHEEFEAIFKANGLMMPERSEVLELVKNREQFIVGDNIELDYHGIKIVFPKTWQNGVAILDLVYKTILEYRAENASHEMVSI